MTRSGACSSLQSSPLWEKRTVRGDTGCRDTELRLCRSPKRAEQYQILWRRYPRCRFFHEAPFRLWLQVCVASPNHPWDVHVGGYTCTAAKGEKVSKVPPELTGHQQDNFQLFKGCTQWLHTCSQGPRSNIYCLCGPECPLAVCSKASDLNGWMQVSLVPV